jgi:hypothetical protein
LISASASGSWDGSVVMALGNQNGGDIIIHVWILSK